MDLATVTLIFSNLTLSTFGDSVGDCNVYDTLQPSFIDRCRRVQDCVNEALYSDKNNLYILDKIFWHTQSQSPIALIINYHVTTSNITSGHDGASASSGVYFDDGSAGSSEMTEEVTYIEQIGWSTTGIYRVIRPVVLVALQPAWYWWTLGFTINNYSLPNSIRLKLNITECDLRDTTRLEVKEALEYLTVKLSFNTTGRSAYTWNTNVSSYQPLEMLLFIIIVSLAIFALLPTVIILLTLQAYYNTRYTWDTRCLQMLICTTLVIETAAHFLLKEYIMIDVYAYIRNIIAYGMIAIGTLGFICGFLRSVYSSCDCIKKASCDCILLCIEKAFIFGNILLTVILIATHSFPVLIEAFIYPTEVITTTAFIIIGIASTITGYTLLKWFISENFDKSTSKKKKNIKGKCCYCLQMLVIAVCTYIIVPVSVYLLLLFYSILLKFRSESPSSQLIQILLSFVPPFLAGLGTFMVRKRLGGQHMIRVDKKNKKKDDDNQPEQNCQSTSTPIDPPSDSADDQEEEQTENEREESKIQQQRRVSINSSQEMQAAVVEVDMHQENAPETTV